MTLLAYASHPIGPSQAIDEKIERLNNIARANDWIRFLVKHTRFAFVAPALTYITALDVDMHTPRSMADCRLVLSRCDVLVQWGGWMSPHMVIDRNHAMNHGQPVVDFTTIYGVDPPWSRKEAPAEIAVLVKMAMGTKPRTGWLPPLDPAEVAALREAEEALSAVRGHDPHHEAIAAMRRIIHAATRGDRAIIP